MKLPILPPAVNQKRLKDGETQQALDNVVTPANVVLTFLRLVFTYVANVLALTVDNLTVNLSATINSLSATNATIATLTTTTETVTTSNVTTLNVSGVATIGTNHVTGSETVGGTLGVTGTITGAGYSGGPISGTTLNTSGLATLNSANVTNNSTVGGILVAGGTTFVNDVSLPSQVNAKVGSPAYFGADKNGAYGTLFGYDFSAPSYGAAGGVIRQVSADPIYFVVNNSTAAGKIDSTGAWTLPSTLGVTGVTTLTGGLNANGGVLAGSRVCGLKGTVGQNSLSVNGTYGVQAFGAGSTAGPITTFHVPTRAGCIAAISAKIYNAVATAGTISIASVGATTNINTGSFGYTLVNNTYTQTFAFGAFPYTAGSQIGLNVTSSGWVQASGTTGIELTLWVYE